MREDKETDAGVGGKLLRRPESAGFELGLLMGSQMKGDGRGRARRVELLELAPGREECLLGGSEPVKADEQQGRAAGGRALKERDEFERQAGGRDRGLAAAGVIQCGQPAAECAGVVDPTGARGGVEEPWRVCAEQVVGLTGEEGEAVEWAGEEGCGGLLRVAGDGGPEGLLLNGIEDESRIGRVLDPGGVDEAVPIKDLRGGPCGEALALADAVKARSEGAGGALTGGDDDATLDEPCVNVVWLLQRRRPHSWVIRLRAEENATGDQAWHGDWTRIKLPV